MEMFTMMLAVPAPPAVAENAPVAELDVRVTATAFAVARSVPSSS